MFRHKGKRRTYFHNRRLAALLSFIAGLVNITGVLSIKTLTTNITGHFAFFAEELVEERFGIAIVFLVFILAFLLGAFISNLLIEIMVRIKPRMAHAAPMLIEIAILLYIGLLPSASGLSQFSSQLIACAMLFAMGLQNALVTKVSDSVVRTTHLTGLFTDLGIELSQLLFFRQAFEKEKLRKSIYLRLVIIIFFFSGCVIGGYVYQYWQFKTLLVASACLAIALFYDNVRLGFYRLRRRRSGTI